MAKAKTTKTISVLLAEPDEKKHVVRYNANDPDAALTTLYVSKSALKELGTKYPDEIRVTIEAV